MPTDNLVSIYPTYSPCNVVVNLQPFVTEMDNIVEIYVHG